MMTVSPIADVLARDLVLVVQGRALHDDAADRDRLEIRDRRQRAAAGRPGCGCRFSTVCACCAGNLCASAQRGARLTKPSRSCEIEVVDLVDDAVDVVGQLRALGGDLAIKGEHRVDAVAQLRAAD